MEGHQITLAEEPEHGGAQIIDLMEALRASLERKGGKAPKDAAAPKDAGKPARKPAKSAVAREDVEPAKRKATRKAK